MAEITREEWLQHAVYEIDAQIFMGELDSINHKFQINCGRVKNNKKSETVQPTAIEDLPMDEFFPTSLAVDWRIDDPIEILAAVTYECIKAFMEVNRGKQFHAVLEKYFFEKPWTEPNPSEILREKLQEIYKVLENRVGKWPGKAVKYPTRKSACNGEGDPKKKSKIVYYCPDCGFILYAKNRPKKENEGKVPTCICGSKMSQDPTEKIETTESNKTGKGGF